MPKVYYKYSVLIYGLVVVDNWLCDYQFIELTREFRDRSAKLLTCIFIIYKIECFFLWAYTIIISACQIDAAAGTNDLLQIVCLQYCGGPLYYGGWSATPSKTRLKEAAHHIINLWGQIWKFWWRRQGSIFHTICNSYRLYL